MVQFHTMLLWGTETLGKYLKQKKKSYESQIVQHSHRSNNKIGRFILLAGMLDMLLPSLIYSL